MPPGLVVRSLRVVVLAVPLALTTACGDDDGAPADAAVDGGSVDDGVTPPNIPWLDIGTPVTLAPCPTGHREVVEDGVTTCDPYPDGGASTCAAGEAHFPGEPGCRAIGDPCPAGEFAPMPSGSPVVYVDDDAAAGGDGSLARPFAALSEVAFGTLRSGAVVALAKGTYPGTLPLNAGVTVLGACAAETRLTGASGPFVSVVSVQNAGDPAVLANVSISAPPQRAVQVVGDRAIALRGVILERATELAFVLGDGATAELEEVVIRDTLPDGSGARGRAIEIQSGSTLVASKLVLDGNRELGFSMVGPGTTATLSDTAVVGTETMQSDGSVGHGVNLVQGAVLTAERLFVAGNHALGIAVVGAGSTATLRDVVVRDTEGDESGMGGRGIEAVDGALVMASRVVVEGNRSMGVFASSGALVHLEDAVVRRTRGQALGGFFGRGLNAELGGRIEATRTMLRANRETGVFSGGLDAVVVLEDVAIYDVEPVDGIGRALNAQTGGRIEGGGLLADGANGGIFVAEPGTAVALEDVVIRGLVPDDWFAGRGIDVEVEATARITRGRVLSAIEVGAIAMLNGSLELEDVSIEGVLPASCGATTCPERNYGHGAVAAAGAIRMTRFAVTDPATCGVLVATPPELTGTAALDLSQGTVSGAEIGACVQVEGYDIARLSSGVAYTDNLANLESTSLPVPTPAAAL